MIQGATAGPPFKSIAKTTFKTPSPWEPNKTAYVLKLGAKTCNGEKDNTVAGHFKEAPAIVAIPYLLK